MTAQFASQTTVSSDRSRAEIESILRRYGADQFAYATNREQAMIAFVANGRHVRFVLPLPDPASRQFTHTPTRGMRRTATESEKAYEQAVRSSWRSLVLIVKAKLEAVAAGVVTFEQEFAMHMVMPDGRTFTEHALPAIEQAYLSGGAPRMELMASRGR